MLGDMNKGLFTSEKNDWGTPKDFFKELDNVFRFDADVCASENNAKCPTFYTKEQDGLTQEWAGNCWMNPPYGREIGKWVKKAYESKACVVCLLPARTDTKWWHDYCAKADVIRFCKGRIKFEGGVKLNPAPFPSAIVIFNLFPDMNKGGNA